MDAGYPPNGGRLVRFLNDLVVEPDAHVSSAVSDFSVNPFHR
jgi:hypothetical protein